MNHKGTARHSRNQKHLSGRESLSPRLLAGRGRHEVRVRGVFRGSISQAPPPHPPSAPSPPQKTAGEKDSRCNEYARTVREKSSRRAQNLWVSTTEDTKKSL